MEEHHTRRRFGLLMAAVLGLGLGILLVSAKPVWSADPPPKQSPRDADRELAKIMANRTAIQGKTRRGQSLDEAPPYQVVPRKPAIGVYPCSSCHDNVFIDSRVRELRDEHTALKFEHGGGRFWCYDACHNGRDMDNLVSIRRRPIDYDQAYKLCGQCHFQRFKDWDFGGHGRRAGAWPVPRDVPAEHKDLRVAEREKIGTWKNERVLLSCPACHNPHSPAIKPYTASPPPLMRSGLVRPEKEEHAEEPIWVRVGAALGVNSLEAPAAQPKQKASGKKEARPEAKPGVKK